MDPKRGTGGTDKETRCTSLLSPWTVEASAVDR